MTPENVLIAGQRRLEACRRLGWTEVPVHVVALDEVVRGEWAENANRENFLPSEIDAIRRALLPAVKEAAVERMSEGARAGKLSTPSDAGKARDKIGAFAGVSGRTVEKIATVIHAATADRKRFGALVEEMDRTGKVDGPYHKLRQARDEERIKGIAPLPGKCRTLVIDPPWERTGCHGRRRLGRLCHDESGRTVGAAGAGLDRGQRPPLSVDDRTIS